MSSMGPYLSKASFDTPEYMAPSTWMEHGPFAFWLVDVLKPRLVVELGVFRGYSFFCFNQAIEKLGIDARTFGIDTWEGDEHSGYYLKDIYEAAKRQNERYSKFSTLIRSRFNDAVDQFEDGSIDILHIDGGHFFDDVSEDFKNWKPKLSRQAIVLFHDIAIFERGFGVFRLWSELSKAYPSFTFNHGCGLGVLGVGPNVPVPLNQLFLASDEDKVAIRQLYDRLGKGLSAQFEAMQLSSAAADLEKRLATAGSDVAKRSSELAEAQQTLKATEAEARRAAEEALEAARIDKKQALEAARAEGSHALAAAQLRADSAICEINRELADERQRRQDLLGSTSWRVSFPLRAGKIISRKIFRSLKGISAPYMRSSDRTSGAGAESTSASIPVEEPGGDQADQRVPEEPSRDAWLAKLTDSTSDYAQTLKIMGDPIKLVGPIKVNVGIVISYESKEQVQRVIRTTKLALNRSPVIDGTINIFDNGNNGVFVQRDYIDSGIKVLSVGRGIGFANGHNHLMHDAFGNGADVYITANPDGAFHPDCIVNLLAMNEAQGGGALIEAVQFPEEHPKFHSAETLETDWISGACFLMSRRAWDAIGGFDEHIFLYCDDVDLSWEAHFRGFKTLTCPRALFYHDVSGRGFSPWRYREMLVSGRYLGHKWGDANFMQWAGQQLVENKYAASIDELPTYSDLPVDPARAKFANFANGFSFSKVRW